NSHACRELFIVSAGVHDWPVVAFPFAADNHGGQAVGESIGLAVHIPTGLAERFLIVPSQNCMAVLWQDCSATVVAPLAPAHAAALPQPLAVILNATGRSAVQTR